MNGKFAILLGVHRITGPLFSAVILSPGAGKAFYTVNDRLSLANLKEYEPVLLPEQTGLVKTIEEYSDRNLLRVFSKEKKNAQHFLASLDEAFIESHLRPYIEKRLQRCMELLQGSETPVYIKKQYNNIYEEDRIFLPDEKANAVFNFIRTEEGLKYYLTLNQGEENITLFGRTGFILINDPCVLALDNRLLQIEDIDGKKLVPFFRKQHILIRRETERQFLKTFAKTVIQRYTVNAQGFNITDRCNRPVPVLSLESALDGKPLFVLQFRYDERTVYYANIRSELQVSMKEVDGQFTFARFIRDLPFENHIISSLLEKGLAVMDAAAFRPLPLVRSESPLLAHSLVSWLNVNSSALMELGIEVKQSLPQGRFYTGPLELKVSITENNNDWFDIMATVTIDGHEIPFRAFRQNLLNGNREYMLADGSILVLPEEWFARFSNLMPFAREDTNRLMVDRQHFPLLKESFSGMDGTCEGRINKWLESPGEAEQPVPAEIRAVLRDYQKQGFNWLLKLNRLGFGGCLADDMGLGKTLQTLAVLIHVMKPEETPHTGARKPVSGSQLNLFDNGAATAYRVKPSLIVVPLTLAHNWLNEISKFLPSVRAGYYGGQNRKPLREYYDSLELIITSYGMVRNDLEQFLAVDFLYLVLDESQVVKNPRSKTYRSLLSIKADHRLVLTGTPVENSLTDLWAQMNFLNPGLLGSFEFFRNEFVIPVERYQNDSQKRILKTIIHPFILRRTKAEVAPELPELSCHVVYCNMSESQQAFYETEKSRVRNLILDNISSKGIEKSSIIILRSLTQLRLAANHPALVDSTYGEDSGKYDAITENLLNLIAEDHKVLVFSSFVRHLEIIRDFCLSKGIQHKWMTGDVPRKEREEIIRDFEINSGNRLFLITNKTGSYGLNLVSADYVFILDPWWNPAVEEQAVSRAHRMGQHRKVFVYRFITKDSIEEKIQLLQQRKIRLAESLTGGSSRFRITDKEEILHLLE